MRSRKDDTPTPQWEQAIADLEQAEAAAIGTSGEHSREHRQAVEDLRRAKRKLDAAKYEEQRRQETEKLTPSEIVDRMMRR